MKGIKRAVERLLGPKKLGIPLDALDDVDAFADRLPPTIRTALGEAAGGDFDDELIEALRYLGHLKRWAELAAQNAEASVGKGRESAAVRRRRVVSYERSDLRGVHRETNMKRLVI